MLLSSLKNVMVRGRERDKDRERKRARERSQCLLGALVTASVWEGEAGGG